MKTSIIIIVASFAFLFSCNNTTKKENNDAVLHVYDIQYAKGFDIKKYSDYVEVTVNNPWDSANILQKYILIDKNKELPENLPEGKLIRTPLQNVVVYSTIHCTILNELNALSIITGVCEPQYIDIDYIIKGISDGTIADLGQASNPNVEKIIMIDPEAIMATPIQGLAYGTIEKAGVPIIETPDYMESTPLGRTEWIKFYSVFLGKEKLADSLFTEVEKKYNEIKAQVSTTSIHPTVFNDTKYGNVWYTPGGKSYMANLLKDAGASYIWAEDGATGSIPLAYETVLDKAGEAEFWLIKYNNKAADMTYESLEKDFKPYSYFGAFKKRNIYGCNTGKVTYYEDLPIHPEYIFQDISYVFHPELFPDYTPRYFTKIEE